MVYFFILYLSWQRSKFSCEHCSGVLMVRFGNAEPLPDQLQNLFIRREALVLSTLMKNEIPLCSLPWESRENPLFTWLLARCLSTWAILKILFLWFLPFMCYNLNSFIEHSLLSLCWIMCYLYFQHSFFRMYPY